MSNSILHMNHKYYYNNLESNQYIQKSLSLMIKEYVHSCYIQNNNCCFGHTIYSNMIQTKTILQLCFSFYDTFRFCINFYSNYFCQDSQLLNLGTKLQFLQDISHLFQRHPFPLDFCSQSIGYFRQNLHTNHLQAVVFQPTYQY